MERNNKNYRSVYGAFHSICIPHFQCRLLVDIKKIKYLEFNIVLTVVTTETTAYY